MSRPHLHATRWASALVYGFLLLAALLEQFGRTTNDTKTPLIEAPGLFLRGATQLWNPQMTFGELQNQAYGYLFPMGPFFLLGDLAHVPPWVTERLWSVLILVVGCEGGRLVARAIGLSPWAAWIAGMAYGLNPRVISQVGVRSAEVLPTAVLPWVLLPILLTLTGRIGHRRAALLSVAAFMFSGAVNGTATAAGLPLVVIVIVWGIRRGAAPWALLGWWSALLVTTSMWWAASLLKLNAYSPPFFDYVEDARTTTQTTGYFAGLRGLSNWVNYLYLGDQPNWPAGYAFSFTLGLVIASGFLAAVGVVGLVRLPQPWRTPLVLSACLGVVCLTIAHTSGLQSPLAPYVQDLLDGPLALLRNVSKADPLLRLPLALGVGSAFAWLASRHRRSGSRRAGIGVLVVGALTLGMAQPAVAMNLRTPGWDEVPDYWQQTADYLDDAPGDPTAWVIPGSGFGVQTWGWTVDEPMGAVAKTPWVTRSQVPLVLPETIRVLSRLEQFLETGAGSPNLGPMLSRLGIGYIVVRHDLEPSTSESTASSLVSIALARSRGVTRAATFGALDFGPAIEVYRVRSRTAEPIALHPAANALTVAGGAADVVDAVGLGLLGADRPAVVRGDNGWQRPADLVGDSYRLRERNFGRVHDAEGAVRSPDEPRHDNRIVSDYPGNPGSSPVYAKYSGIDYTTASSSQAFTDVIGVVRPENAPFAAVDDDPESAWRSAYYSDPRGQWLEVRFDRPRYPGKVTITSAVSQSPVEEVLRWKVTAGGVTRKVDVDPITGRATVGLGGRPADRVRFTVDRVKGEDPRGPVSVLDVDMRGLPAERTLVVPEAPSTPGADFMFTAQPETRGCITTLLGPDCSYARRRLAEEGSGIDRTVKVPAGGTWEFRGTAIARAMPATVGLLDPWGGKVIMRGSSALESDPAVSARMAYDGSPTTSWIADPYDASPTLVIDWSRPRTIRQFSVASPASPAVAPSTAVLRGGNKVRKVDLGGFGRFAPLRTDHLEITFTNPTRGLAPIGMSGIAFGSRRADVRLDGAARTGAVCGYGPNLEIDGRRYATRVDGLMGDVVSAGPLGISLCRGSVRLSAGTHRIRVLSTVQFQPVRVSLTSTRKAEPLDRTTRPMRVMSDEPSRQEVAVGPGEESLLTTTRNFNRGWRATLDGEPLEVQRVDGWAQGWRVPAGAGGVIEISYAPERSYVLVLFGGLAVAGLVLVAAVVALARTRLRPWRPVPPPRTRDPDRPRVRWLRGRRPVVAAAVAALPAAWLLGGVPAVVGLLVAAALWVRRLPALPVAAVVLLAAPVAAAYQIHVDGPSLSTDVANAIAGVGFVLAVASLARPRAPRTPRASAS